MKRGIAYLPLLIFIALGLFLAKGLYLKPHELPSPFIGRPAPHFELASLFDSRKIITEKTFHHEVTLVNVWASWCVACAAEHDFLMQLAEDSGIRMVGWNYKDTREKAKAYLAEKGNPFALVIFDPTGQAAIEWGVYGTPETFILDKQGTIRFKQVGQLNQAKDQAKMMALIGRLKHE